MHRRTARGNRLGLAVTGVLLAAAGAALLVLRHRDGSTPIYPSGVRHTVHEQAGWLWPLVAAVAIVVGLVFLRWLLAQARTDRVRALVVDSDEHDEPGAGRTSMPAHALTDAVEDAVLELTGVRRVSATLSGHRDAPELWLRVWTDADADLGRIRTALTSDVLTDARASQELPALPTQVHLEVTRHAGGRALR